MRCTQTFKKQDGEERVNNWKLKSLHWQYLRNRREKRKGSTEAFLYSGGFPDFSLFFSPSSFQGFFHDIDWPVSPPLRLRLAYAITDIYRRYLLEILITTEAFPDCLYLSHVKKVSIGIIRI